jgi:predicted permease
VIAQVALSVVLLVGAILFVRTLRNLKLQDLGIDREHTLLVWTLPDQTGRQGRDLTSIYWAMQERLSTLPGVVSASGSINGVLTGDSGGPALRVEGAGADQEIRVNGTATVGPRYFETLGQRLLAGREFTRRDAGPVAGTERTARVVIVNESLARRFFGNENPLGRRLVTGRGENAPAYEIVGVVSDARYRTPRENDGLVTYWPVEDGGRLPRLCMIVRAAGSPASIASRVRQEIRAIAPTLPILKIDTVDEQLDDLLFQERLITNLTAFFGGLAVLLACLGLYGVMSYTVAQRTREIGLRLALGATPAGVFRLMLRESLLLVLAGIAIGIPVMLAVMRLVASRLFGLSAHSLPTLFAASALLILVALLACWLPAKRAAKVDPMVALRHG